MRQSGISRGRRKCTKIHSKPRWICMTLFVRSRRWSRGPMPGPIPHELSLFCRKRTTTIERETRYVKIQLRGLLSSGKDNLETGELFFRSYLCLPQQECLLIESTLLCTFSFFAIVHVTASTTHTVLISLCSFSFSCTHTYT